MEDKTLGFKKIHIINQIYLEINIKEQKQRKKLRICLNFKDKSIRYDILLEFWISEHFCSV